MQDWMRAKLPDGAAAEAETPLIGESVVLYCRPRKAGKTWQSEIGSLDFNEEDGRVWASAFGLDSGFDGMKFKDILRDYEIWFAPVPPLDAGRFPSPMTKPVGGRDAASDSKA